MNYSEGIWLGLSTGVVCLSSCGPVVIPYLMGENRNVSTNFVYVSIFLGGRLFAYLVVGLLVGLAGQYFLQSSAVNTVIIGIVYIILSALLILYGFYRFKEICLGKKQPRVTLTIFKRFPLLFPLTGGIITGINICPPFMLAIAQAASLHRILGSILFFMMFFLGTSLYFIPLPFIGIFKRTSVLRVIGKFAAITAGLLYLFKGIFMIF